MEYIKERNVLITINGDQNAYIFEVHTRDNQFQELSLVRSQSLYLDEIIDFKFMNSNKHAVFCSNSETLKFIDLESGNTEILPGHTDIIITIDKFKNFIITGAKDNECRLWHYNADAEFFNKIKCIAVFKGHTMNISCVHFSPKKGYQFVSSSEDNTIKVWNVKQLMHQALEKTELEIVN